MVTILVETAGENDIKFSKSYGAVWWLGNTLKTKSKDQNNK